MTQPSVALRVEGLRVALRGSRDDIVDEVSFSVSQGELLGLVGESGSGKTTGGLAMLGHARPGAAITAGTIEIAGIAMLRASRANRREMRGSVISYVAQDPAASLNPALRVGTQLR